MKKKVCSKVTKKVGIEAELQEIIKKMQKIMSEDPAGPNFANRYFS